MRKLEGVVKEITDEMDYLKRREEKMRDTNGQPLCTPFPKCITLLTRSDYVCFLGVESTNARVQNFALFTMFVLIALGAWQVSSTPEDSSRKSDSGLSNAPRFSFQILHLRSFFKRKYLID